MGCDARGAPRLGVCVSIARRSVRVVGADRSSSAVLDTFALASSTLERIERAAGTDLLVRGVYVAPRIETRALRAPRLGATPLVVEVGQSGAYVVFRYGVLVYFGVSASDRAAFETRVQPLLKDPFADPLHDELVIRVRDDVTERVHDGVVICPQLDLARVQVIAHALAKSIALMRYEDAGDAAFDEVEPLAAKLENHGRTPRSATKLAKRIGAALSALTRTVGRLEVAEKPEVLWEHPELDLSSRSTSWLVSESPWRPPTGA